MILSQKERKGRDGPFFPPLTYLHTQEVTGSSPVVSTKKNLILQEIRFFSFYSSRKSLLKFSAFSPTNVLANTAIVADRMRQYRAGIFPSGIVVMVTVF